MYGVYGIYVYDVAYNKNRMYMMYAFSSLYVSYKVYSGIFYTPIPQTFAIYVIYYTLYHYNIHTTLTSI